MLKLPKIQKKQVAPLCYWDGRQWLRTTCSGCPSYPRKTIYFLSGWFIATIIFMIIALSMLYVNYAYPDTSHSFLQALDSSLEEAYINGLVKTTPEIEKIANILVADCDEGNLTCEVSQTHYLMQNIGTYVSDVREEYSPPERTLKYWIWDCEDSAIAFCSLMKARNITCEVKVLKTHAYAQVNIYNQSVPVDVTGSLEIGRFLEKK